ncbi:hypothetical protein SEA_SCOOBYDOOBYDOO_171 [Mycobacterium phage ScoobyDoobyDoo]|nr:hypothetical protein SEA_SCOOBYDOOBYDOO_171 [Mycobacterium phage ScoobyDoobyDoo]
MTTIHARNTDPETSHLAAEDSRRDRIIYELLRAHVEAVREFGDSYDGMNGLTAEENAIMAGFDPKDGAWRRCSDLRNLGWISWAQGPDGRTLKRRASTGKLQGVARLTDAGVDAYLAR